MERARDGAVPLALGSPRLKSELLNAISSVPEVKSVIVFRSGVAVVPGCANVIAFQTADGLVLVDTGLQQTAQALWRSEHP